jgi:hypothetical protein
MRLGSIRDALARRSQNHSSMTVSDRSGSAVSVVVAAGYDFDPLIDAAFAGDPIDQPTLAFDAARPPSGEVALQRLRLAEPTKGRRPSSISSFVQPNVFTSCRSQC